MEWSDLAKLNHHRNLCLFIQLFWRLSANGEKCVSTTRGNPEAIRMAYFPAHVLDVVAECRDRVQGDARVVAAFVLAVYVGRLHAGNFARKARCAGSSPRSSVHR